MTKEEQFTSFLLKFSISDIIPQYFKQPRQFQGCPTADGVWRSLEAKPRPKEHDLIRRKEMDPLRRCAGTVRIRGIDAEGREAAYVRLGVGRG